MASKMNVFTKIVRPDLLGTAPLGKNMTFAVKANIGCGFPAPSSTPSLRDWIPKDFSPVVRPLVDSGHQIVAIANMHELRTPVPLPLFRRVWERDQIKYWRWEQPGNKTNPHIDRTISLWLIVPAGTSGK